MKNNNDRRKHNNYSETTKITQSEYTIPFKIEDPNKNYNFTTDISMNANYELELAFNVSGEMFINSLNFKRQDTPPIIDLEGTYTIILERGTSYTDPPITVTDNGTITDITDVFYYDLFRLL